MPETAPRTPTHIWVEGKIRELSSQGIGVYVVQKGERNDGTVLLKMTDTKGQAKLHVQQRNLEGMLAWVNVFQGDDVIDEKRADEYIARSKSRDPDQWIIEIEHPQMDNPFKL
ncbi:MAG: DUF1491 family protein [Alphaproteobacteria bacterium]|nr:DUF1491 family protein [Alphaproteobacteria bacterium]NCQ87880.1 DUF1491 family protein [Alphaproteobacteria bacterium]NCT05612.1 DUF1491 family protein [Alphaproteobacteria bacterium]